MLFHLVDDISDLWKVIDFSESIYVLRASLNIRNTQTIFLQIILYF